MGPARFHCATLLLLLHESRPRDRVIAGWVGQSKFVSHYVRGMQGKFLCVRPVTSSEVVRSQAASSDDGVAAAAAVVTPVAFVPPQLTSPKSCRMFIWHSDSVNSTKYGQQGTGANKQVYFVYYNYKIIK